MVTKKKKKEKKITFVFFKDQRLKPKSRNVIPTKTRVRRLRRGLLTLIVYAAE
jgi:hypothetical protein